MDPDGLRRQMGVFRSARIIIGTRILPLALRWTVAGTHGAGLTNMLHARNATIIELPLRPHVNRCYAHMALSLGHRYWVVPQVGHVACSHTISCQHRSPPTTISRTSSTTAASSICSGWCGRRRSCTAFTRRCTTSCDACLSQIGM